MSRAPKKPTKRARAVRVEPSISEQLAEIRSLIQGKNPGATGYRLSALAADYLVFKRTRVGESTCKLIDIRLRNALRVIGDVDVEEVTHDIADQFIAKRVKEGVLASTAALDIGAVNGALLWAVRRRKIPHSNLAGFQSGARAGERERVYTQGEIDLMIKAARGLDFHACHAVITVMRWTGVRPTELLKSRVKDLDFKAGVLTIRAEIAKRRWKRDAVVQPDGLAAIRECMRSDSPWLIPGRLKPHQPTNIRTIDYQWHRVTEAAGIAPNEDGTPPLLYSLRHTLATYLGVVLGYNEFQIMAAMGWKDIKMARKYVRHQRDALIAQSAELAKAIQAIKRKK